MTVSRKNNSTSTSAPIQGQSKTRWKRVALLPHFSTLGPIDVWPIKNPLVHFCHILICLEFYFKKYQIQSFPSIPLIEQSNERAIFLILNLSSNQPWGYLIKKSSPLFINTSPYRIHTPNNTMWSSEANPRILLIHNQSGSIQVIIPIRVPKPRRCHFSPQFVQTNGVFFSTSKSTEQLNQQKIEIHS